MKCLHGSSLRQLDINNQAHFSLNLDPSGYVSDDEGDDASMRDREVMDGCQRWCGAMNMGRNAER